uniref:Uncharacterized protein n=1 Tax=Hanusia phi TaxID=3032 RepID=A0A7S0EDX2_9CRYP|mmetsp:Transcript_21349/g.48220  ORF Transcript_21349/g.48220 Transcript_21349/m.48220 type:complete len:122 (+) Transcript_21349:82-447(+)
MDVREATRLEKVLIERHDSCRVFLSMKFFGSNEHGRNKAGSKFSEIIVCLHVTQRCLCESCGGSGSGLYGRLRYKCRDFVEERDYVSTGEFVVKVENTDMAASASTTSKVQDSVTGRGTFC